MGLVVVVCFLFLGGGLTGVGSTDSLILLTTISLSTCIINGKCNNLCNLCGIQKCCLLIEIIQCQNVSWIANTTINATHNLGGI